MPHNPFLEAALRYAAMGIPVFPLQPRGKKPLTDHGFKDATPDPEQIRRWWEQWPNANIGAPTGEGSGFWVLDIDAPEGEAWLAKHPPLPHTPMQRTAKGRHIFLAWCDGLALRNTAKKLPSIDTRGEGGYIVLAPSVHPSGVCYEWIVPLLDVPLAPAQGWLLAALAPPPTAPATMPPILRTAGAGSRYGIVALERNCQAIAAAPAGQQNSTLNASAYSIGRLVGGGELSPDYALRSLCHAGLAMNPSGKPWTLETVLGVVRRALAAGAAKPKTSRK